MAERIVVFHNHDPLSFVADGCAALAEAVNEPHVWSVADEELIAAYAAMVRVYAGLVRPTVQGEVTGRIIDHVLERLGQAERGQIATPVLDIVDRLHGLLVNEPALR
jgi:hypothetical protein